MNIAFDNKESIKTINRSGYFRYTDHYSAEPDNIYISTLNKSRKVNIIVTTHDGIFTRSSYLLNKNELIMIANMIKLAWKNPTTSYISSIISNNKEIEVKTEKAKIKSLKKHLTIKINNKIVIYGFDIEDSRRLYKLLADLINKEGSGLLS